MNVPLETARVAPDSPGNGIDHATILGIRLDRIDLEQTMARIVSACETHEPLHIVTVNLNFITLSRKNRAFAEILNNAGLSVTDGRILQWLTRFSGKAAPEQITGHDLLRECVALAAAKNWGVFLLGGGPGVALDVAERLRAQYPGLRVTGTDHGHFTADGRAERQDTLEEEIRAFQPQFLFLALGTPKQEFWIARHLHDVRVPVAVGIGSVFDVISGRLQRAPKWMQRAGLESVYQVIVAPRRYFKRYVLDDPPTLVLIVVDIIKRKIFPRRENSR